MIARTLVIARREFAAYFATPLAAVFLVIFLFLAGLFTFNIGSFYERGQADLRPFFQFHPWLFLFLVPAVSMRLWAEERRTGTIELLTTLPFRLGELVVGKFLAAWGFTLVALALTGCGVTTRKPAVAKHQEAPDFELSDERGRRVALSQLTAGFHFNPN